MSVWGSVGWGYALAQSTMWAGMWRSHAPWHRWLASPLLTVPTLIAAGLGTGAAAELLHAAGATGMIPLVGAAITVGTGYAAGRLAGMTENPRSGERGALVLEAAPHDKPSRQPATRSRDTAITLAGQPLSVSEETKHFKIVGTTGSGKSTAVNELLGAALRRGDRAIITDPDGGYLRRFYDASRGDVILNPFDARSPRWDLFAEIRASYDVDQLARALIPDHEGSERIWRGYARTFFSAVTSQAHEAGVRDLSELYRLLVLANHQELRTLTGGTPAQPFLEEQNARMFESVRSVTSSAIGALEYIAEQRASTFSVRDWVARDRGEGGVLFIPYRASQIPALRSNISAWMRLAIFEAMEKPEGDQHLWFVVDELDALGQIDGLKDALARLRKFGGRCVLGFQSVSQVASTYGAGDAHTIVENCGNSLLLRCSASEGGGTARFASALIGQREVWRDSHSTSSRWGEWFASHTHGQQLHIEPAVLDAQIEQLPDLQGYLKLAARPHWQRVALRPPAALGRPAAPAYLPVVPAVATSHSARQHPVHEAGHAR